VQPTTPAANTADASEALITANLPLVGYLVAEIGAWLPAHVSFAELRSAGHVALVQAARSYDETRGVPFARYASVRIRGALIDELRSHDWATRSVRARARRRDSVEDELAMELGRRPTPEEVAERMGVAVDALHAIGDDVHRSVVLSIQGFESDETVDGMVRNHEVSAEEQLVQRERTAYLVDGVAELPERLRLVITALYFEERTIAEIAAELGVTESRISQMRTEALGLLREAMNSALDPELVTTSDNPEGRVARKRAAYAAAVAQRSSFAHRVSRPTPAVRGIA
jgi:RNA polymerase sigma factor for flagellar operon FliA